MPVITLEGCDPFDGSYDLSFTDPAFNAGDLNIIKTISGVRAYELQDAFQAGDTDLIVALAVIALCRAGKTSRKQAASVADVLWNAPSGALRIQFDDAAEGDAGPPDPPPAGDESASSVSGSGSGSGTGTESQEGIPRATGSPG